jgi:hypothetical protein
MTTQFDAKGFRTINAKLRLWQKLTFLLAKNPKYRGISELIEAIIDQNKKLRLRVRDLEEKLGINNEENINTNKN